jgi:hypothetical protein
MPLMTTSTEQCACGGWTPISESRLLDLIKRAETSMEAPVKALWELVRLPDAEIWQQHPWADEGCGFWVLATFSRHCLYFNDVTQGFAVSPFRNWGNIDHFEPDPTPLDELIERLTASACESA